MAEKLIAGEDYTEVDLPRIHAREIWKANEVYLKLADFETAWTYAHAPFSAEDQGDEIALAKKFYAKYHAAIAPAIATTRAKESQNNADLKNQLFGNWKLPEFQNETSSKDFDITTKIDGTGIYQIMLNYRSGAGFFQIDQVELLSNGNPISVDHA
jgi:hypothetical protein